MQSVEFRLWELLQENLISSIKSPGSWGVKRDGRGTYRLRDLKDLSINNYVWTLFGYWSK